MEAFLVAMQRVQPPARSVQVGRMTRTVQCSQDQAQPGRVARLDSGARSALIEVLQAAVPKAPDHWEV
jgi:hypothetical protein